MMHRKKGGPAVPSRLSCASRLPTTRTRISHFQRLSSDHQLQNCTFCNGMASGSLSAPLFVPNHPPGACRIFHNISCSWKMSTSKWTHPSRDGPPYWQKNRPFFPIPPRQTPSLPRPAPKTHEKVLIAVHCHIKTDRGANEKVFTNKTFLSKESTPKHTWYLSRAPRAYGCKFFSAGVNFYRFNAKNWQFTVYFAVITQKIGNLLCILS